jgi:diacylglycerol kinase family enzyme
VKRVAFLVNKTIKRYDNVFGEIEYRCKDDLDCKFFISNYAGHLEEMAGEAVREGYRHIITVGGDGSVNETLNGVLSQFKKGADKSPESYDWEGVQKIRLGLFPGGSGNDFARYLGLKPNIRKIKDMIRSDAHRPLDIGWALFTGKSGKEKERFFINITDVGMGGATVQHMEKHRIPFLGSNLNYMKAILSSFISYEKTNVRWVSGQRSWEGKVMSMVVANGKFFGSGLGVAPDAEMDDGLFSLVTLADITMMDYLKNMRRVKACQKIEHSEVSYNTIEKVLIEPADQQELPIDMDGDFVGYCPLTIQCIPKAINFLA